jgi:hypothetical protein
MLCTEFRNLVMSMHIVSGTRERLHNGGIHPAFIHAANHIFFRAVKAKDAALAEMCMRIDYFGHCKTP